MEDADDVAVGVEGADSGHGQVGKAALAAGLAQQIFRPEYRWSVVLSWRSGSVHCVRRPLHDLACNAWARRKTTIEVAAWRCREESEPMRPNPLDDALHFLIKPGWFTPV